MHMKVQDFSAAYQYEIDLNRLIAPKPRQVLKRMTTVEGQLITRNRHALDAATPAGGRLGALTGPPSVKVHQGPRVEWNRHRRHAEISSGSNPAITNSIKEVLIRRDEAAADALVLGG
jgi:hypothetical protein